jgi:hypothetical protein
MVATIKAARRVTTRSICRSTQFELVQIGLKHIRLAGSCSATQFGGFGNRAVDPGDVFADRIRANAARPLIDRTMIER